MIELIGCFGILIAIIGSILAAKKKRECWPVWLMGCIVWFFYAVLMGSESLMIQQALYVCINVYGWVNWKE